MTTDLRTIDGSDDTSRRSVASLPRIPALDGVRTIAVYLVVAFHAGLSGFDGGFIGVDVFFVLSGFLITRLLLDEYERHGRVDLPRFYARRARRLLPAAWVAIVTTAVLYVGVATPFEREAVVGDARAALLYVANWNFIREGQDYFAESLESSPFLHLWSLSVEEQFYLVWPIVALGVFALWRRSTRLATIVVIASTIIGALWALRLAGDDVVRAYYGTDTRAYQLLAGAAVSLVLARRSTATAMSPSRSGASVAAAATAGAVVAIVVFATTFSLDPVERGIAATIATVVLVAASTWSAQGGASGGTSDLTERASAASLPGAALGSRPMVALGNLSYATYLWHWPIVIVFGRVFDVGPRTMFVVVALSSTALAKLSMDLIERPARRLGERSSRRRDLLTSAVAVTITVVLAVVAVPAILRSDVAMLRAADRPGFASTDASAAPPTAPVGVGAEADETLSVPESSPDPTPTTASAAATTTVAAAEPVEPTATTTPPTPTTSAPAGSAPLIPPIEEREIVPLPFGPEPTDPIPVPDDLGQGPVDTEFTEKTGCVNEVPN